MKLDQRTKEARLIRETRAELMAHVGGNPSATQRALIEALVQIKLRLALLDRQLAQTGVQTEHDSRTYLAHANTYGRMLGRLGITDRQEAPLQTPALADYLAGR
jgi:hypothetical protein